MTNLQTRHKLFVVVSLCAILWGIPCIIFGQTLISHDTAGNRSAEVSNQPTTAPVIVGQPQTLLGQVGGTYSFSVTANGANLTYQWYKDSTAISGATSDTLAITNALSSDFSNHSTMTGMYSVVVSNSAGSVTSNSVALYLDSYGVGIPDWWQQQYFPSIFATGLATDPVNPLGTPNNNGVTNLQAYQNNLNPTSAATEGYSLTVTGPVSVQPRQASYAPGTTVTLSVPNGMLQNWAGDVTGCANPLTLTVNRSMSIQAITAPWVNTHSAATLSGTGYSSANALLVQANGQVMVGGQFDTFAGVPQGNLGRLNANGTVDPNFFPISGSAFPIPNTTNTTVIYDMAQQPDGKIVVVGNFTHAAPVTGANPPSYIARFNTDGTLDQTFMANGLYPDATVSAVAVQSDGHIIIAGSFGHIGSALAEGIARLNSDGSLDTTFGIGTTGTTWNSLGGALGNGGVSPGCLQVDSSNNIYLGGTLSNYNGTSISNLVRLTPAGAIDTTFSTGSGFSPSGSAAVTCLVQNPAGGLYVGGNFTGYNGSGTNNLVALTSTGGFSAGFGTASSATPGQILLLPGGQLVVSLNYGSWQGQSVGYVIELSAAGVRNTSFNPSINNPVLKMALLSNGDILIGGLFTTVGGQARSCLAELTSSGSLDTSAPLLNLGSARGNPVDVAAQEADGKLLVDGEFNLANNGLPATYQSAYSYSFVRLNTDGSLDSTFNCGTGPNRTLNGILPLPSGQNFLYGNFSAYNGTSVAYCALINADGTLDGSFSSSVSSIVNAAGVQSTGSIVVSTGTGIERLTAGGGVDSTFHIASVTGSGSIAAVSVDSQDRILIGGEFSAINGQSYSNFARLNSDGTLDTTFTPPAPNSSVSHIGVSKTGLIVIQGAFSSVGGTSQLGLAEFTSGGTLNPAPGQNAPAFPQTIGVQSDGGIVVGTHALSPILYRLTPAGTVDPNFSPGLNNNVNAIVIGNNDDIFALGTFTADVSNFASGIVHYSTDPHLDLAVVGTVPTSPVTAGTPMTLYGMATTSSGSIASASFLYSSDGINYQPASGGNALGSGQYSGVWAPPAAGTYYLRLVASDSTGETGESPVFVYTAASGSPLITTPTLSLTSGTYSNSQFVTVSDTTPGVQIYYTLDGSNPATSSTAILLGTGGIIPISQTSSLNVEAIYGSGNSSLASASYTINSSLSPVPSGAPAYYPNWWFTRGVILQTGTPISSPHWPTNYPAANDYTVINQGQLKNLAMQAYTELTAVLPPTAWSTPQGQCLTSLVSGLNPSTGDAYAVVNLGQLKTVAQPFYDLLKQQSMVNGYPWTGTGADDYSVANIGQAKNVFNSTIP